MMTYMALPKSIGRCAFGALLLRGSWVVLSGAISRVSIPITHIRGLLALLIATHEPPSNLTCKP